MSLITLAFVAALVGQESVVLAPCEIDRRSEACEQARFSETLAEFGLPTIEAEAATGAEVYRVFLRNPWGRVHPVISFQRRPGEPPAVVVKDVGGNSLSGPVSLDTWRQIVDGAVYADRDLVPLPPSPPPAGLADGEIYEVICTDSSTFVVELANTRDRWGDALPVRRKTQNTCDGGLATQYGDLMAELAVKSLPSCSALVPAEGLDANRTLGLCLSLTGDTMAGAELVKEKGAIPDEYGDTPIPADEWASWLNTQGDAQIDWAGHALKETPVFSATDSRPSRLSDFMAERSRELEDLRMYFVRAGATDADHGWMEVEITYDLSSGETMIATGRLTWRRLHDEWSLESWVVASFRSLTQPE